MLSQVSMLVDVEVDTHTDDTDDDEGEGRSHSGSGGCEMAAATPPGPARDEVTAAKWLLFSSNVLSSR